MSCQETSHPPVDKGKGIPWPLALGPWPSIPVSILPTKCSEQAAAGSRRQQQQTAGSSGQQQGQLNQAEFLIFEMSWNMKMVQTAGVRRVKGRSDSKLRTGERQIQEKVWQHRSS